MQGYHVDRQVVIRKMIVRTEVSRWCLQAFGSLHVQQLQTRQLLF